MNIFVDEKYEDSKKVLISDVFQDRGGGLSDWAGVSGPLRAGDKHQPRRDRVEWDQRRWVRVSLMLGQKVGFILSDKTMGEVGERVNILKISQLFTKCRGKNLKQIVTVPADAGYLSAWWFEAYPV